MPNLQLTSIDHRDLTLDPFLSNLQGNILKGHGRDNTTNLFIKFNEGQQDRALAWVHQFAEKTIVSCKEQMRQRELFQRNDVVNGLFAGMYVTPSFYTYFSIPTTSHDSTFFNGMQAADLSDPPVSDWETGFQQPFHAMILLANDKQVDLGIAAKKVVDELQPEGQLAIAEIVNIEYGASIRNANDDGVEHFGYVDGISQPLFIKEDVDRYKKSNLSELKFDPPAALELVLVADPFSSNPEAFGSYMVFRKLEQDVRGFKKAEQNIADTIGLTGDDRERAGAMLVGRFEDGTPVTLSETDKMISSAITNNFNYQELINNVPDDQGARCPFHAHIRKANPRRSDDDKTHIMARRGITYGHRNVSTTLDQTFVQMPSSGVGLLFMSFQKSITTQFEFIQRAWVNNENFPVPGTGVDDEMGQGAGSRVGKYPVRWNDPSQFVNASFNQFVTLKGGEYFFAPSLAFLKSFVIGQQPTIPPVIPASPTPYGG